MGPIVSRETKEKNMTVDSREFFEAKAHFTEENGEYPEPGKHWFAPKKITYSKILEVTLKIGYDVHDYITIMSGPSVMMEIAEVDTPNGRLYLRVSA